jgi:hypothetical protein
MSVNVQWYDESEHILHYQFRGEILWDDYLTALSYGRVLMQSVPHLVCVLYSLVAETHLPEGFVTKVRTILETEPDNRGCIVFISPSRSFIQMMDKVQRIIPHFDEYCFYAGTEEEAIALIHAWNEAQVQAVR